MTTGNSRRVVRRFFTRAGKEVEPAKADYCRELTFEEDRLVKSVRYETAPAAGAGGEGARGE